MDVPTNTNPFSFWIKFLTTFSTVNSVTSTLLVLLMLIIIIIKKERTIFTSYSIQLGIFSLLNICSYFLPLFQLPFITNPCLCQAFLHIISLNLLMNMFFVYFLIIYVSLNPKININSVGYQLCFFLPNLFIVSIFAFFYFRLEPLSNNFSTCRFQTNEYVSIINYVYAYLILLACVRMVFLIKKNVRQTFKGNDPYLIRTKFIKMLRYLFLVILFNLAKLISIMYSNTLVIGIANRVLEHFMIKLLLIFFGIGIKSLIGCLCQRKVKKNTDVNQPLLIESQFALSDIGYLI